MLRLVEQTKLHFEEGRSDKVYEVDLCMVGPDQFVVNFRYGRRGAHLRDGTKTVLPVARAKAERIFADLVSSKTKKGYRVVSSGTPGRAEAMVQPNDPAPPPRISGSDPRARAILERLASGRCDGWRLSRTIWRAGRLGMAEAVPYLIRYTKSNDFMQAYSSAWALGPCGINGEPSLQQVRSGMEALTELVNGTHTKPPIRRIASASLLMLQEKHDPRAADKTKSSIAASLPEEIRPLLDEEADAQSFDAAEETLRQQVAKNDPSSAESLVNIYVHGSLRARPCVLWALDELRTTSPQFSALRHLFKIAELRGDGDVFGKVLRRFELGQPQWGRAFKPSTRTYLRRRAWRTLRQIGEIGSIAYTDLAAGVLLAVTDDDALAPRAITRYDWNTGSSSIAYYVDRFSRFYAFNFILYGNSPRYQLRSKAKSFSMRPGRSPEEPIPDVREEAFPVLWQRAPHHLLRLLQQSRCEPVHQFGCKALRACPDHLMTLEIGVLATLLASPYEITAQLGFETATKRFNPAEPDAELILATANSTYARARDVAYGWMRQSTAELRHDAEFIAGLIASPRAPTREHARQFVHHLGISTETSREVVARLVADLVAPDNTDAEWSADVAQIALTCLMDTLRELTGEVISDLAAHPLAAVQVFAGKILVAHPVLSRNPPGELLRRMIDSEQESVRRVGMELFGKLSDAQLLERASLIASLAGHRLPDMRETARPLVKRLAGISSEFAGPMVAYAVEQLCRPKTADEVRLDINKLLREALSDWLDEIPESDIWRLLRAPDSAAQEIGGILLNRIDGRTIDMTQIVELASHEVLSVREASWRMLEANTARVRTDLAQAIRILDAKWEDSRAFAARLFGGFDDQAYTPEVLISICDSVRDEVQRFGRDLVLRNFAREAGPEYLAKLSEHPSPSMQSFVSNLMAQYAAGQPERIASLVPFFASVLARVNRGRVAKDRVLAFFDDEARKDQRSAEVIVKVLAAVSNTMAVTYKARAIAILTGIQKTYPHIAGPLRAKKLEVRGAV